MLTISKQSRLVRFAYCMNPSYAIPEQTSLCKLFWRTIGLGLLITTFVTAISVLAVIIGNKIWHQRQLIRVIEAVLLLCIGLVWYTRKAPFWKASVLKEDYVDIVADVLERTVDKVFDSLFWKFVKAVKQRMCPIIKIVD